MRRPSFFLHLHPPTIPAPQARWRHTLGAGGLAVYLILVLVATGALELFYYVPTAEQAAESVQIIAYRVPYGGLVRNLHYWAGQALVIVCIVHLLRVIFTGAYLPPRRFNYQLGLLLLGLVVLLDFTGYALRWDEGVRWALVAGTNLLKTVPLIGPGLFRLAVGGDGLGTSALVRLYAWHIFGLMLPLIGLGIWHLFRVRRDGGIAAPPPELRGDADRLPRSELLRREAVATLAASAALIALSVFFPAPIAAPMSAQAPLDAGTRAPWFLLWVQQLLRWGDPRVTGVLIPLAFLAVFVLIPYIFPRLPAVEVGRWFPPRGRWAQALAGVAVLAMLVLTVLALVST